MSSITVLSMGTANHIITGVVLKRNRWVPLQCYQWVMLYHIIIGVVLKRSRPNSENSYVVILMSFIVLCESKRGLVKYVLKVHSGYKKKEFITLEQYILVLIVQKTSWVPFWNSYDCPLSIGFWLWPFVLKPCSHCNLLGQGQTISTN